MDSAETDLYIEGCLEMADENIALAEAFLPVAFETWPDA